MFAGNLVVSEIAPGKWRLAQPLLWLGQSRYQVPYGFVTDFASVPKILWPIVPPYGKYTKAAVLHDYLYTGVTDRKTADSVFLKAMKACGTPWWRRYAMWAAVRIFGASSYATRVPKEH